MPWSGSMVRGKYNFFPANEMSTAEWCARHSFDSSVHVSSILTIHPLPFLHRRQCRRRSVARAGVVHHDLLKTVFQEESFEPTPSRCFPSPSVELRIIRVYILLIPEYEMCCARYSSPPLLADGFEELLQFCVGFKLAFVLVTNQ